MSGKVRIQHGCERCDHLWWAPADQHPVYCPSCGMVVDEYEGDEEEW